MTEVRSELDPQSAEVALLLEREIDQRVMDVLNRVFVTQVTTPHVNNKLIARGIVLSAEWDIRRLIQHEIKSALQRLVIQGA